MERESRLWAGYFFSPEADPYRQRAPVVRTVHRAMASAPEIDILRHAYQVSGLRLAVSETLGWVHVEVSGRPVDELLGAPAAERPAKVNAIVSPLLAMTGRYDAPAGIDRYVWNLQFSPNAPSMSDLPARVEGGIHGGHLWLLMEKRRRGTPGGRAWPAPDHWFDGEASRGLMKESR